MKKVLLFIFAMLFCIVCGKSAVVASSELHEIKIADRPCETLEYAGQIGYDFESALDSLVKLKTISEEIRKEPLAVIFDYDDRYFCGIGYGECGNYTDVLDSKGNHYLRSWYCPTELNSEFAPIGAEWYYTNSFGCCPENHFQHIISEKDTVVEGNHCRVLRQYYDNSTLANEKYIIKQEQGKIYYYYQNQFNLLFDFDAEVNDIVEFTFIYKKYDDFSPSYKDTILSARFKIEEITTNARNFRTFITKVLDEDAHKLSDVFNYLDYISHYTYSEKIGLHGEFMPMFDNVAHPAVEAFRWLRCYSDADFSFMSDEWSAMSLPCDYSIVTSIDIPKDENIKIYPNPVNDNVFVFTSNGGNIEIIDISGKTVYHSRLSDGINEISISHFSTGIYFVKIRNKDNSIQTFKIIKS